MSSSLQGKKDSHLRIVSSEDAVVFPENAAPTDDAPTVISKSPPAVDANSSSQQKHLIHDLARQSMSPETLVASLRGRRLAHYELIEPIGVGGMAAVIRARDTQLDRFVALKILPPETALELENVQRFHQEAKAAAKLDHENIARVFYCGEDQGLHFIAFEFVDGVNLRTLMERRGTLPVREAVGYVLQVALGLEHAATRGVVHRDVKPSNIIITPAGRAKLVDMGLARNMDRKGERDLTQSGVTLGTFDYISPEQALEPREADSRSDIYSLGCTFYHMLTGKAPVPEGTPAKKLHHHQHVLPEDPRQTNPDVPSEVIAVLGKMMAKNPKDRYQRPIQLVHNLMQVAQKVGAADDLPEGVLFVDAPVVEHPRSRPFLMIGMALAVLVAVVFIASLAPDRAQTPPKGPAPEKVAEGPGQPPKLETNHASPDPNPLPPVLTRSYTVWNANDLQAALADRTADEIKVTIEAQIELDETGLVFRGAPGQRLVLDAGEGIPHATIAFRYKKKSGGVTAGLVVEGGKEIVFRKIRFQLDSGRSPREAVGAVVLRGAEKVVFDACVFSQPEVPAISPNGIPLASLLIGAEKTSDQPRPIVVLRDCCFDSNGQTGGQVGVAVNGPAQINLTSCAFMPHGAFFQFRHDCKLAHTEVHLQHCTGFVTKGPAFRFDADTSALVNAKRNVFLRPNGALAAKGLPEPDLFYLAENASFRYLGDKNIYYNLNADLAKKGAGLLKVDDFQAYLVQTNGADKEALRDLSASPLREPQSLDRAQEVLFQLKPEYEKYGLERTWMGSKMPETPEAPLVKTVPVNLKVKLVDAETGGSKPGVYKLLESALREAQDGDIIQIKSAENQEIKIQPVHLTPGISVTLRPHENSRPILVLDNVIANSDSYFFKVQSGGINLEQLEFRLDPGPAPFDYQSVVQLGETAQCSFKSCVLSLKTARKDQLNVVTFLDADKMMKMEPTAPAGTARVEFQDCFVRGRGDLVTLRGCRQLHVEVRQSLIALDGSLLDVKAVDKALTMDQGVRWKMERSSIFTAESIFALRSATNGKGLATTTARIEGCLLVALAPRQPVVMMHALKDEKYLEWVECKQNFYVQFDELREWKMQYPEDRSVYDRVLFPKLEEDAVQTNLNLWDATPDWFKPADADKDLLKGFGVADADRLLSRPTPADEN